MDDESHGLADDAGQATLVQGGGEESRDGPHGEGRAEGAGLIQRDQGGLDGVGDHDAAHGGVVQAELHEPSLQGRGVGAPEGAGQGGGARRVVGGDAVPQGGEREVRGFDLGIGRAVQRAGPLCEVGALEEQAQPVRSGVAAQRVAHGASEGQQVGDVQPAVLEFARQLQGGVEAEDPLAGGQDEPVHDALDGGAALQGVAHGRKSLRRGRIEDSGGDPARPLVAGPLPARPRSARHRRPARQVCGHDLQAAPRAGPGRQQVLARSQRDGGQERAQDRVGMLPARGVEQVEDLAAVDQRVAEVEEMVGTELEVQRLELGAPPAAGQPAAQQRLGLLALLGLDQRADPGGGGGGILAWILRLGDGALGQADVGARGDLQGLGQRQGGGLAGVAGQQAGDVGADRQGVRAAVLGVDRVVAGGEGGDAHGIHPDVDEPRRVPRHAADLVVAQPELQAVPEAGDLGARVGRGQVHLDDPVHHADRPGAHVLVAEQAGAVPQVELEVVPDAGERLARDGALHQGVALVRAAVVDGVDAAVVQPEEGHLLAPEAQHARRSRRQIGQGERAGPGGRAVLGGHVRLDA